MNAMSIQVAKIVEMEIPQDGFESIQYSKPWSWSIGGWVISSGLGAAMAYAHFTTFLLPLNPTGFLSKWIKEYR